MTSRKPGKVTCRQLPNVVRNHIRTGFIVNTIGQCIEELVYNSIDANATRVDLEVDFSHFSVTIEDNGDGISKEDFEMIGKRYATSKCLSLEDLKRLKFYGYRGEALSSIIDCSSLVEITTKPVGGHAYRRVFTKAAKGPIQVEKRSSSEKDKSGVKISISDLMGSYPVRQKGVKKAIEIVDIKDKLEKIALINPNLTVSFKDTESKKVLLEIFSTDSLLSSFKQFLKFKHHHLVDVCQQYNVYNFCGVISKEEHSTKDYQLVYVNKKPMPRHKIHRAIHQFILKGGSDAVDLRSRKSTGTGDTNSTGKSDKYPVFVVNIESPYDDYDITIDPHKSIIEFKHYDKLVTGVDAMVGKYFSLLADNGGGGGNSNAERIILKRSKSYGGLRKNNSLTALASINRPFINKADINLINDMKGSIRSRVAVKTKAPETVVRDDNEDDDDDAMESIAKRSKSSKKSVSHAPKSITSWRGKNHNSSSSSPSTASSNSQDRLKKATATATLKSKRNPLALAKRKALRLKDVTVKDKMSRSKSSTTTTGGLPLSLQSVDLINKIKNDFPVFGDVRGDHLRGKKRIHDKDNDNSNERGGRSRISESPPGQLVVPLATKKRPRNDKICESISKLSVSQASSPESGGSAGKLHKKRKVDMRRKYNNIEENDEEEEIEMKSKSSESEGNSNGSKKDRAMMPSNKQQIINSQNLIIPATFNIKDKSKSSLDTTTSSTAEKERALTHLAYYTKIADEKCKALQHKELTSQIQIMIKAQMEAAKCSQDIEELMELESNAKTEMVRENENSQRSQYFMSQSRQNDVYPGLDSTSDEIPKPQMMAYSSVGSWVNRTSPNPVPFEKITKITTGTTAEALFKSKLPHHPKSFPNQRIVGAFGYGFNKIHESNNVNQTIVTSDYFRPPQNKLYNKPQSRPTILNEQQDLFKYLKNDEGVVGVHNETFVVQQPPSNFPHLQQRQPLGEVETVPLSLPPPSTAGTVAKDIPDAIKSRIHKMIGTMLEDLASANSLASSSKWGNNTSFRLSEPWDRPIHNEFPISNLNGTEVCIWKKDRLFKFLKEDLRQVHVIAQYDSKFIVSKIKSGDNYMLVLFDQHAVHERIRLEDMIKETQTDGKIISYVVDPPVEINFTDKQLHIILSYPQKFENVGIKILNYSTGLLRINGIPKTFIEKALNESIANRGIVVQKLVHSLIEEVCDDLIQTRGVETETMPKTIFSVLQSIACHGAIKFGDMLSIKQCEDLLYKLQFCQTPFQCAHGRPVVYPLIDLDDNLKKFANSDIRRRRERPAGPGGSQSQSQSNSQSNSQPHSQQGYITTSPFFNWENPSTTTSNITGIERAEEDEVIESSKYFSNPTTNDDLKLF